MYNILTIKVLPDKVSTRFLDSLVIGQERYKQFLTCNVEGNESIWDPLKKEKLTTFVNNNKTAKVKIDNKDVYVWKNHNLPAVFYWCTCSALQYKHFIQK